MKKFATYFFSLLVPGLILLNIEYNGYSLPLLLNKAKEVFFLVNKSKKKLDTKTLLLGDSVCKQLFAEKKNAATYCLCNNQSYEIPGNFILLKNLIEANSSFDKVILIINPTTLTMSLNQEYTFNYFIKPFGNDLKLLDKEEVDYINKTFPNYTAFSWLPVVKHSFSNWDIGNEDSFDDFKNSTVSATNIKYLKKIIALCEKHGIEFQVKSPPAKKSTKAYVDKVRSTLKESDAKTNRIFSNYFKSIIYFDDEYFQDGIHFSKSRFDKNDYPEIDALIN
ncbi:hypothetical protein QQ020_26220 [Fulvivirgaceae bacterium BMA12]|uniref:SGNH/GDSL hydrolase family protein n=1 Tax=Agaribacillus aureus TaxID=3051825 RepID=A0ABT8LFR5_9BACT|nr:hypothetical protein [Fulvivirgaceae bacterium BMA12]